jgi:putative membrane protein
MLKPLSREEHDRISTAIQTAEACTSGEIYCVLARSSGSYFFPAAFAVLAGILVASVPAAILLEYFWLSLRIPWFVAAQLLAVACSLGILWRFSALRVRLVPHRLRFRMAHDNARKQFLARNVHVTDRRTGVLVFVSLEERYAEIVADSGISDRIAQQVWNDIVTDLIVAAKSKRLAEGYIAAIAAIGDLLAKHFPVRTADRNELDDHLIEI